MGSIGEMLKSAREAKNISLQQAEDDTKIRKRYLQALEEDEYDVIPGRVYAKGFLRTYAGYLGLNQEEIMMEFKLMSPPAKDDYQKVVIHAGNNRRRSTRSDKRAYLVTVLIALLAIATLLVYNFIYKDTQPNETGKPSVSEENNTAVPQPAGEPSGGSGAPADSSPGGPAGSSGQDDPATNQANPVNNGQEQTGINITLNGKDETCWAKITVDGTVKFSGFIYPGETKSFTGTSKIVVTLGNAGAVEVIHNGKNLGAIGVMGEVVKNKEFTIEPAPDQQGVSGSAGTPVDR